MNPTPPEPAFTGPRIGDTVRVEIPITGTVVEMAARAGTPGVLIAVTASGTADAGTAWFPLTMVTLMQRRTADTP